MIRRFRPAMTLQPALLTPGVLFGGLLLIGFVYCYFSVVAMMVGQWWTNDVYSYCFLIPAISGYLVWTRRAVLKRLEPAPDLLGGAFVFASGLLMQVAGYAGGVLALQELSLIVTGTGMILFLLGRGYFKKLWFSIAYLLLMIPSWEIVTDRLHFPFQRLSATLGVALLRFIGIPVHQQGVFIELPNITLEVARVCSGVNYLIAVFAVGLPLAYDFLKGWRRVALLSFALVVAILSNSFRVALIGTLSYYGLNPSIHGPFHILQGMFVSVIGYCALFAGFAFMVRRSPAPRPLPVLEETAAVGPVQGIRRVRPLLVTAMFVPLLLTGSYLHLHKAVPVSLAYDLQTFPIEIGMWQGRERKSDYPVFQEVGVDRELSRTYQKGTDEVHLYIGYFESQRQGKELINYKTADLHRVASRMMLDLGGRVFEVNRAVQKDGEEARVVLFWYDVEGRRVADRLEAQVATAWSGLVAGRTSAAILLITTPLSPGRNADAAVEASAAFVREALPLLDRYLSRS